MFAFLGKKIGFNVPVHAVDVGPGSWVAAGGDEGTLKVLELTPDGKKTAQLASEASHGLQSNVSLPGHLKSSHLTILSSFHFSKMLSTKFHSTLASGNFAPRIQRASSLSGPNTKTNGLKKWSKILCSHLHSLSGHLGQFQPFKQRC
jgi:hypothetical protein